MLGLLGIGYWCKHVKMNKMEKIHFFLNGQRFFPHLQFFIAERKYKFRSAQAFLVVKKKTPKRSALVDVLEVDAKYFCLTAMM